MLSLLWIAAGAFATSADGSYFDMETSVAPTSPSSYVRTVVTARGESTDGCVPELVWIGRTNNEFIVAMMRPFTLCTQIFTSWKVDADLGHLQGGSYTVHFNLPLSPFPDDGSLESIAFEVATAFGGDVYDAEVRKVVCSNRTTGQRIVVKAPPVPLDCEALGLLVSPGDDVGFRILGTKSGEPSAP
jgi:hypothetical protein